MVDTLRCIVEKDGVRQTVVVQVEDVDNKTLGLKFPAELYEGDGFLLLWIEGEPELV